LQQESVDSTGTHDAEREKLGRARIADQRRAGVEQREHHAPVDGRQELEAVGELLHGSEVGVEHACAAVQPAARVAQAPEGLERLGVHDALNIDFDAGCGTLDALDGGLHGAALLAGTAHVTLALGDGELGRRDDVLHQEAVEYKVERDAWHVVVTVTRWRRSSAVTRHRPEE